MTSEYNNALIENKESNKNNLISEPYLNSNSINSSNKDKTKNNIIFSKKKLIITIITIFILTLISFVLCLNSNKFIQKKN